MIGELALEFDTPESRQTARVEVSPAVLKWALERSGRDDIADKFPHLVDWIEGTVQPTLRQLEAFSKATSVPFGYLLLPEPPQELLPIPHFRTASDKPVYMVEPNLFDTINKMLYRQAWMREYLIDNGHEPLPFVGSARINDDPLEVAQNIRNELGLQNNWAKDKPTWEDALRALQNAVEDVGILVVVNSLVGNNTHRKLNVEVFRGFVLVDEYVPLIFINGSDSKAAQMFTLVHELVHVWFGKSASFDLEKLHPSRDPVEAQCNKIAAEFLVPENDLRTLWVSLETSADRFGELARRFKVSEIVVARRALDLHLIEKREFNEFYNSYQKRYDEYRSKPSSGKGGDFYATQNLRVGKRFARAVVQAVREGKLLYREAYRLTDLHGETFEKYASILYSDTI